MSDEKKNRLTERLRSLEQSLKEFWRDYSRASIIKAANAEISIEPRMIIAEKINPEVARRLVVVFLSQVSPEDILDEQIVLEPERILIRDEEGNPVLEITDPALVDIVSNEVTGFVGSELSRRPRPDGENYLDSKETGSYTFGEIKTALVEFLLDQERKDSKNLLKDATLLLMDEDGASKLVRPTHS